MIVGKVKSEGSSRKGAVLAIVVVPAVVLVVVPAVSTHLQASVLSRLSETKMVVSWKNPKPWGGGKNPARILPIWGEFLKREEKGEEKKELERGLHIFSPIVCSVSSRVKARFFGMVNEQSAEIITQQQETGNFLREMTMLLQCGPAIVVVSTIPPFSLCCVSTSCLSLCTWLIVDFDAVVVDDCIVTIHLCRHDGSEFPSPK